MPSTVHYDLVGTSNCSEVVERGFEKLVEDLTAQAQAQGNFDPPPNPIYTLETMSFSGALYAYKTKLSLFANDIVGNTRLYTPINLFDANWNLLAPEPALMPPSDLAFLPWEEVEETLKPSVEGNPEPMGQPPLPPVDSARTLSHPIRSNAFLPMGPFSSSVDCQTGDFSHNLFWDPDASGDAGCDLQTDAWLLAEDTQPPVAQWSARNRWFENDYRLDPDSGFVDAGDPDPMWLDPDGSSNDPGLYGGPEAARGVGPFTARCLAHPLDASGLLFGPEGAVVDGLNERDLPLDPLRSKGERMDVWLVYLEDGGQLHLTVETEPLAPSLRFLGPDALRDGELGEKSAEFCTAASEQLKERDVQGSISTRFVAETAGYHVLVVSAGAAGEALGAYAMSWRVE